MARPIYEGKRVQLKSRGKSFLWIKVRNIIRDDLVSVRRQSDGTLLASGKVLRVLVNNLGVTLPYAKLQLGLARNLAPAPVQDEVIPVTITLTNSSGNVIIEDEIIIDDVDPTITKEKKPKTSKVAKGAVQARKTKPKSSSKKKVSLKKSSPKGSTKRVAPKKKK